MKIKGETFLDISTMLTFILSVVSLALESGITLIISATLMSVCILLSFIEKGRSKNSESWK
jgi:hypothetical protein